MYSFPNFEPVCCSMSSSTCCFLTCIQVSQEAGKLVWYSHLLSFVNWQVDSLPAEPQGKPKNTGAEAYSFSSKSSQPRSLTRVFCIASGLFTNQVIREAPICRVHHAKCWAEWSTSWNQGFWEKYQQPQICNWYQTNGRKWGGTKEPLDEGERQ